MAKSKPTTAHSASRLPPPLETVGADDDDSDEVELLQVDLGDFVKLKQVLDEAVSASVLQHVAEDVSWDNVKLLLMTVACIFAMIAQFAPIPFPESRPVLGVCGTVYFLLSGVLQWITTFIDKDCILLTQAPASSAQTSGWRVRTSLPRFSESYTVILEPKDTNSTTSASNSTTVSKKGYAEETWSVGKFFDKEGYFDEVGLQQEMDKLVQRFLAQNSDRKKQQ